eukprot:1180235-Prorocentrum_minimum.AAC.8
MRVVKEHDAGDGAREECPIGFEQRGGGQADQEGGQAQEGAADQGGRAQVSRPRLASPAWHCPPGIARLALPAWRRGGPARETQADVMTLWMVMLTWGLMLWARRTAMEWVETRWMVMLTWGVMLWARRTAMEWVETLWMVMLRG